MMNTIFSGRDFIMVSPKVYWHICSSQKGYQRIDAIIIKSESNNKFYFSTSDKKLIELSGNHSEFPTIPENYIIVEVHEE